jgi:hypothetical protein
MHWNGTRWSEDVAPRSMPASDELTTDGSGGGAGGALGALDREPVAEHVARQFVRRR